MRAMRVRTLGARMVAEDLPDPVPGPGEVRIQVRACGVNFADTLMIDGRYQERQAPPFTPGMEVCGTVAALGPGAEPALLGRRVAAMPGAGGFAEAVCLPAAACVPVPEGMTDAQAAGFIIAYATSLIALQRAALAPGETLLVLGAAGGVGLTAVEVGRQMGATVIACARGAGKLAVARRAGAHHLIDSDGADLRAEVKALGGADVVYDPVGGALFDQALRATRPGARLLPLGFASGTVPQIPANILLVKNLSVIGFYLGGHARLHPEALPRALQTLFDWFDQGCIAPHVSHEVPLDRANDALELLRSRAATGKVVVTI
ncbi:zinc-binding dehydrogenase [Rhodobacteraceae bacterium 2CG4]|uniref:Zinc-binding dehydrogenase n=1 Tax=Halovulum marinum TaxID=2662447 RepID=A0A6L5YZL6_9RHOB|nr:NADPH:quinone oxidoreductase family protein [Halovulum marinum]MSU89701.1 zinc-binding dehydrogenase [Halovulum marinum]